ncbi:MAG: DNA-processing protein DprA, partial [Candidatus Hydrogenedentes bacterium]|nr:DNA-processing protein DprA [Candidatus Hydrogenedentota bacterium]
EGIATTAALAAEFAAWDAVTVSGGAEGVDQAAHRSATGHGGATVIVMPMGILRRDAALLETVDGVNNRALYMSHTHPMNLFAEYTALERNAVVSALSRLVCVVEPGKAGGSIVTARCAIQQRRPLFVHHTLKEASVLQPLFASGAQSLTNDKGEIAWSEIKTAWDRPAVPPEQQAELF